MSRQTTRDDLSPVPARAMHMSSANGERLAHILNSTCIDPLATFLTHLGHTSRRVWKAAKGRAVGQLLNPSTGAGTAATPTLTCFVQRAPPQLPGCGMPHSSTHTDRHACGGPSRGASEAHAVSGALDLIDFYQFDWNLRRRRPHPCSPTLTRPAVCSSFVRVCGDEGRAGCRRVCRRRTMTGTHNQPLSLR